MCGHLSLLNASGEYISRKITEKNPNCQGYLRPFPICRSQFNRTFFVVLNAVNCVNKVYKQILECFESYNSFSDV